MIGGRQLRIVLAGGILMAALPTGFARAAAAADANDFKTEIDRVSYILGTGLIRNAKIRGVDLNVEMVMRGVREAAAGQKLAFSDEEQTRIMTAFQQKIMERIKAEQEAQAMAKLGAENAWKLKLTKPELMKFDATKDYFWILETNKGNIRIKLMPDVAPMHVTSTIFLTNKGFYDGTIFHRVIPGFMAQGGDPTGTGTGTPGYQYGSEIKPNVKHDRPYVVSMANTGAPNTDGSQFFITFVPTPGLDGKHTIFGEVVEGQETVKKLEAAGTQQGKPKEELKIVKAKIEEKTKG
jgi:cyclophilin family peptidyl-prolyl cis-trans isomerase